MGASPELDQPLRDLIAACDGADRAARDMQLHRRAAERSALFLVAARRELRDHSGNRPPASPGQLRAPVL